MTTHDAPVTPRTMRRIALASGTGTVIEYYDFFIFATAAALVFPKTFFPALGSAAGTVASFATLGVAFVARPLGSILFGHFGDRLGRKTTLVTTLLVMGLATFLVGLMPTADTIGAAAPILLVVLRLLQGLAVGGEWTGATLMAAENAPKDRRGFWSMFGSLGGSIGMILANATFLLIGATMSTAAFESYGWRIPFLTSFLLVAVGFFIRMRIEEPAVFRTEVARRGTSSVPFVEALRNQPREIALASGVMLMIFSFYYLAVGYMINFGTTVLHLSRTTVLSIGILAGAVFGLALVLGAACSDRVGRRRVILAGNGIAVVWALALFPVLDSASAVTFALASCVTTFISGFAYGPVGAFMPELFRTRYRYTAAGFAYNVAGVLGGAVPPLIAAAIVTAYGGIAFGGFLALLCLISLGCTLALRETRDTAMEQDADAAPAPERSAEEATTA
ncbi:MULTISPECIES: MFS transporter [Streptomyces]|uniref:MFS transporter n=1 Tax=Streptomyces cinereoruber TaxID=67260 RepID=A0ABX6BPQ0_9ACTN|nr:MULTISPECIES: MFS transporter [Streptomyces]AVH94194.1 MFS transporter [Streptomyces sp. WAC00288]KYG51383.1 MFS transporter [Streptomyces sp. WAC04657]MBB4162302.1 MFS family permease [Streptomyces cinereoruber]MBY8820092.1 MHS family MFS transporter [Streptomyces cinereoruber]NIH63405.1 MFS family permease [Streptomyces cinereoruber]